MRRILTKPPYELLAIDLDGTLLDLEHRLPARNRAALHRAHAAGMKIVICTGRSFTETRPVIADIGLDLDATVTVFGALLTELPGGRTIARDEIPLAAAERALQWFQARGYPVMWLIDHDRAGFDGYDLRGPKRHPAVDFWLRISPCRIESKDQLPAGALAPLRLSIIDDADSLRSISDEFAAEFGEGLTHNVLHAPNYNLTVIEVFAPHVNKWHGVEQLCRRWSIDPRRTVAMGDDVNDVHMIQNAGLGIAMGNARPEVHRVARRCTGRNEECGVASVIEELLGAESGAHDLR